MKYIDEPLIHGLLAEAKNVPAAEIEAIINKSLKLERLSLKETAALLSVEDPATLAKLYRAAAEVKDRIYGKRVVLFAPLYISNICANGCLYCAFKADNKQLVRKALNAAEIKEEVAILLSKGHKRILLVAGESAPAGQKPIDYYVEAVKAIYEVKVGPHKIRRVNINCAPLEVDEFRRLKEAGIGTFQIFQETYHEATYRRVHPFGPKSDPDNRIDSVDRAMTAGIDDVGIGVLYGLYDYKFETLALLAHIEHLEAKFKVGPHTISVPRIEPALGSDLSTHIPHPLTDEQFKKVVAVLRLAVPYTGLILSTRETAEMRDELFNLGISQVSAESKTAPGGYGEKDPNAQFVLNDHRSLDEVIASLLERGFIPSFCAACYRSDRTGEAFMNLAKPGTIKGKCSLNALITLKEYLDDFASTRVRQDGYKLIDRIKDNLDDSDCSKLAKFFASIEDGARDEYV